MASKLERRGNSWTFRYCKDGRNLWHTCFAFTKQEAEIEKVDFLHSLRVAKSNNPARLLFNGIVKEFFEYVKTNKKSPATYIMHLNALKSALNPVYIADVNTAKLNDYIALRILKGLSKSSINRHLNSISSFFTYLKNIKGYTIDNPVSRIKKFKLKLVVKTRVLTNEEIALIFSALDSGKDANGKALNTKETTSKTLRAVFALALYAGLRLKECKLLKRENILFDKNSLIVEPQKTSESDPNPKTIPLHNKLREYLTALFKAEPADNYVAPYIENREIDTGLYSILAKKFLRRIGIKEAGAHTCRHTYISKLANSGIDSADILKYARITNLKILEVYRHITTEKHSENINRIDY